MHSQVDPPEEISVEDAKSLIHELRVHRIELEMQNEELRQAQAQIEESRERYADLYDFAPVGYLALNDKGHVVDANLAAATQLGTERGSLIDAIFPLYVNPKDRQQARLHIMTVFKTRGRQTCELRLKPKGGEEFYARLESIFIENTNGEGRCRTSISDISYARRAEEALQRAHDELEERVKERTAELTEANERLTREIANRKHAEEALRESEERQAAVIENLTEGLIVADARGLVIYWNSAALAMFGYACLDECRRKLAEFADTFEVRPLDDDRPLPVADWPLSRVQRGEVLRDWEVRLRRLDQGWEKIFSYSGRLIRSAGGETLVLVSVTDITERKQMEESLRASERLYRAIGESIDYGIWVCAPDGRNTYASKSFLELVGITQEECSDFGWGDVLHPEDAERTIAAWQECVRTGGIWDIEHRFLGADRRWHPILARGVPVRNGAGEIVYWAGINLDISALKEMEEDLRKSRDELESRVKERTLQLTVTNRALMEYAARLEQLNEELEEFTFVASHDLQEPLRKIQTFGSMLIQNYKESLTQQAREYLMRINGSAKRMSDSLHSLLNYSRLTSEPHRFEHIDLGAIAQHVVSDLETAVKQAGGRVEIKDLPTIEADAVQIYLLLQNLIDNSIKYRKDGENPVVKIHGQTSGSTCTIFVEDNGIGFDEKYLDRIFKPFQQLHSRDKLEGIGMGLALCRKIANAMRGALQPGACLETVRHLSFGFL